MVCVALAASRSCRGIQGLYAVSLQCGRQPHLWTLACHLSSRRFQFCQSLGSPSQNLCDHQSTAQVSTGTLLRRDIMTKPTHVLAKNYAGLAREVLVVNTRFRRSAEGGLRHFTTTTGALPVVPSASTFSSWSATSASKKKLLWPQAMSTRASGGANTLGRSKLSLNCLFGGRRLPGIHKTIQPKVLGEERRTNVFHGRSGCRWVCGLRVFPVSVFFFGWSQMVLTQRDFRAVLLMSKW